MTVRGSNIYILLINLEIKILNCFPTTTETVTVTLRHVIDNLMITSQLALLSVRFLECICYLVIAASLLQLLDFIISKCEYHPTTE